MNPINIKRETALAIAFDTYTNPAHPEYDHAFDAEIRRLRPDWFEKTNEQAKMDNILAYEELDHGYQMMYQDYSKLVRRGGSDKEIASAVAELDWLMCEMRVAQIRCIKDLFGDLDAAIKTSDSRAISDARDRLKEAIEWQR